MRSVGFNLGEELSRELRPSGGEKKIVRDKGGREGGLRVDPQRERSTGVGARSGQQHKIRNAPRSREPNQGLSHEKFDNAAAPHLCSLDNHDAFDTDLISLPDRISPLAPRSFSGRCGAGLWRAVLGRRCQIEAFQR